MENQNIPPVATINPSVSNSQPTQQSPGRQRLLVIALICTNILCVTLFLSLVFKDFFLEGRIVDTQDQIKLLKDKVSSHQAVIDMISPYLQTNTARQTSSANNTKRASNVEEILNAISQYMADSRGQMPAGIPKNGTTVTIAAGGLCTATTCADICSVVVPKYLAGLPIDPSNNPNHDLTTCPATYNTGYTISSANDRVTVAAPKTDTSYGSTITSVTR